MQENLDYERLLKEQPWLCQRDLLMVVSPDFDGLLCALMMTAHLGWKLCGFYDGKILALDHSIPHICELVFLDMEIYRPCVRSIGNHMLQWSSRTPLPNFQQAVNPNLLRGITASKEFDRKYPFGTSHFLLALLAVIHPNLQIPQNRNMQAILLYPDGTHQVLLNYRGNVIDWLDWMGVKKAQPSVRKIFQSLATMTLSDVVHGLDWLSQKLKEIGFTRKDDPCKFDPTNPHEYAKAKELWQFLQQVTGWQADPLPSPIWFKQFDTKSDALRRQTYLKVLDYNPLSFALTSKTKEQGFQYTLVPPELRSLTD